MGAQDPRVASSHESIRGSVRGSIHETERGTVTRLAHEIPDTPAETYVLLSLGDEITILP